MRRHNLVWLAACLAGMTWVPVASAQQAAPAKPPKADVQKQQPAAAPKAGAHEEEPKASEFLHVKKDAHGKPLAMETAIVRYVPIDCSQTGPTVDLVAAVHIGESDYYHKLNEEFKKYDVVLYELVAPEGTRVPKGGGQRSSHPVSMLQQGMTQLLELTFQLNKVDYTAKNFVHADLSGDQLSKAMAKRGESIWTMLFRSMGYALAQQNKKSGSVSDADLLMALLDKNRALALKRVMAEQFQDMEGMMQAMAGPDGSALIADRNAAALAVLKKQIAEGKGKVAIFYGAGHMSDMEKRLRDDFALVPIETRWLKAWDLEGKKEAKALAD